MSAAIVSPLTSPARRSCTEQDVGCVKGQTGQILSRTRLNNVSLIVWEQAAPLQIVQIWPLISNNLCNHAKLFLEGIICRAMHRHTHVSTHCVKAHTHTHTRHGWLLSQCVRLLVYEMRGVPFISSPWFSSTANRSMYASPSAVSGRHGSDSEPKRANRKDVNCCETHTNAHTHLESSSKEPKSNTSTYLNDR